MILTQSRNRKETETQKHFSKFHNIANLSKMFLTRVDICSLVGYHVMVQVVPRCMQKLRSTKPEQK